MGLYESMRTDRVSSLAMRPAICCRASDTIRDAIQRMRSEQVGCVAVVEDGNKPVGIFTEAMLRQLIILTPAAIDEPLESHMATTYPWVNTSDSVEMVLEGMESKNLRFVLVLDEQGAVCGLTGQKGLMEYVAEYFPGEVMVQRIGGTGHPSSREGA